MRIRCRVTAASVALAACILLGPGLIHRAGADEIIIAQADTLSSATPVEGLESTIASPDASGATGVVRRPWLAIGEIVASNTLIWSYDRYIRQGGENPGFKIGFNTWEENLKNGFEWDDNNFGTNQFAHPYHGGLYFNAARSNGYDFWESIPFAFAGSYMWEFFYEKHHASYNDWVNTSVGGVSFGEMLWRLSDMVLDNTAQGGERRWREFGGLFLNPSRGVTRMVTGEWSRVGPNPPGTHPESMGLQFDTGTRTVGAQPSSDPDTTRIFMELRGIYGDPFHEHDKPFDAIDLGVMLNFGGDAAVLAGVKAHGLLGATELKETEKAHHVLGYSLNYDYFNTNAFEAGQQSMGVGLMSRFAKTPLGDVETLVELNGIILGSVKSDYDSYTGRAYDYGPGASAVIGAALTRRNRPWLAFRHGEYWIHTLNGTDGEHFVSITRLRLELPVASFLSVGSQGILYLSDGNYDDLDDTHRRQPELRFYLALPL